MSHQTDYDLRMRRYKSVTDTQLVPRMPVIIQIDGRAFHTFTRGFEKPFDVIFATTMRRTANYLCNNIQGCVLAYTQSDEINLLLIDYESLETSSWFNNRIQKLTSVAASMATNFFNKYFDMLSQNESEDLEVQCRENPYLEHREERTALSLKHTKAADHGAEFAACAFNLPREEVTNYFNWRQQDAIRNSIQMVGQAYFSPSELHKKSSDDIKQMLLQKNINWDELPLHQQRGTCNIRSAHSSFILNGKNIIADTWTTDFNIPIFKNEGRDYIERFLYPDDTKFIKGAKLNYAG